MVRGGISISEEVTFEQTPAGKRSQAGTGREKAFQEEGTARAKAPRAAGRTGVAAGRSLDSVEALPGEWPAAGGRGGDD